MLPAPAVSNCSPAWLLACVSGSSTELIHALNGVSVFAYAKPFSLGSQSAFQKAAQKIRSRRFAPHHEFFSDKIIILAMLFLGQINCLSTNLHQSNLLYCQVLLGQLQQHLLESALLFQKVFYVTDQTKYHPHLQHHHQ